METTGRLWFAIGLILLSVFLLSGADAVVKAVSADFPLWQIYLTRSLFAVPILLAILAPAGRPAIAGLVRPWVALRSLLLTGMWLAYYAALPHMALSVAATALYTTPLFIAAFSSGLAGEAIGRRALLGIALGFLGVLVILRPTGADFSVWTLLPVLGAVLYAGAAIITRTRCSQESPYVLALSLHAFLLAEGMIGWLVAILHPRETANPFLFGPWAPMLSADWLLMFCLGCIMVVVAVGVAKAYQSGPSAVIGTFDYAYLVFAAVWGVLFFAEKLDLFTLTGMGLILTAGVLVLATSRQSPHLSVSPRRSTES